MGEIQDVYIKKTNSDYRVVIRTPKGDFYVPGILNSNNYPMAKLFFKFWKKDLIEYGHYYKVNDSKGRITLSNTPI